MDDSKSFYDRISKAYDLIADANEHKSREAGLEALDPMPGWYQLAKAIVTSGSNSWRLSLRGRALGQ